MSLTTKVLLALVAGMGIGLGLNAADATVAQVVVAIVEPIGTLFVNAIRMTVIPLVVASLIAGVASSSNAAFVARIGMRGILVFVTLLAAAGIVGALMAPPILSHVSANQAAIDRARAAAPSLAANRAAMQTPSQWLVALVPANAVRAAVDGTMLPLIVFSLAFGLALISVAEPRRMRIVMVVRALAGAMLVIVRWLLVVAPIGVFALALPLAAHLGLSAVGALAAYVILVCASTTVFTVLVVYPAAALGGGISIREFARAAAPAQAVAASSRSSLAALPALIESARTRLNLPEEITGFFLPLATATFRIGATLVATAGTIFIARLYGVPMSTPQVANVVVTAVLISFSVPGIPGGSMIAMIPVLASAGLPAEGVGILFGVDTIPDIFLTTANVTAQLAAAVIVSRGAAREHAGTQPA